MPFCRNCGNQVNDFDKFCGRCGYPQIQEKYTSSNQGVHNSYSSSNIIDTLRTKIRTEAIVWVVIASMQVLGFFINLVTDDIKTAFFLLFVAIANFITCKNDFDFEKRIVTEPVGIVAKYKPIGGYIFMLIYNLIFGGVFGVIGVIFCFITRSYVVQNEQQFIELENNYKNSTI